MPPVDYLQLNEDKLLPLEEEYESVVELFLSVIHHRWFLADVVNFFYCLGKRRDFSDQNSLLILSHLVINVLNNKNKDEIIDILDGENLKKVVNFMKFFNKDSIIEDLFLAGCQYFEEDYVLEKLLSNIKGNNGLLKDLLGHFEQLLIKKKEARQHDVTRVIPPRLSTSSRSPPAPPNTPQDIKLPPPKPVPNSTYKEPEMSKILAVLKEQNKETSLRLLEAANQAAEQVPAAKTKQHVCSTDQDLPLFKPACRHKPQRKSDVPVKKNATTILREASRVIKEEEKEIQRVHKLLSGAANYTKYEELLEQVREQEEQAKLEDIERKHLNGLLSREEAILARQVLLEANKAKKAQFDLERRETEKILKQMRQKHNEKLKEMIEKTQQIQRNIEEKKKNMIDEKQKNAQQVADTTRQLYEDAMRKQKEELEKRIEIIKEIKALSNINELQDSRFDPTETMNLGLLCEMSLAELHERLLINRASFKQEIENRQMCIKKQRQKQQQFLADTEQFIEACRQQKKVINNMVQQNMKQNKTTKKSQDIIELREKLEKARNKRMELMKND